MNTPIRLGTVIGLVALFAACGSSGPTSPTGTNMSLGFPSPTPSPQTNFPPLSGPSRTFMFDRELSYPVRDFTRQSLLVLYDNGAFALQYPSSSRGDGRYRGAYQDANGVLMFLFEFQGRSVAEQWDDATGTLKGESLTLEYDGIMQQADFENAVYLLMP